MQSYYFLFALFVLCTCSLPMRNSNSMDVEVRSPISADEILSHFHTTVSPEYVKELEALLPKSPFNVHLKELMEGILANIKKEISPLLKHLIETSGADINTLNSRILELWTQITKNHIHSFTDFYYYGDLSVERYIESFWSKILVYEPLKISKENAASYFNDRLENYDDIYAMAGQYEITVPVNKLFLSQTVDGISLLKEMENLAQSSKHFTIVSHPHGITTMDQFLKFSTWSLGDRQLKKSGFGGLMKPIIETHPLPISLHDKRVAIGKKLSHEVPKTFSSLGSKIINPVGYFKYEFNRIDESRQLYEKCSGQMIENGTLVKELKLENDLQTWFNMTILHVWIVNSRLRAGGPIGKEAKQELFNHIWLDVEMKLYESGVKTRLGKSLEELIDSFYGICLAYDEGLAKGDAVLAGAIWKNFYRKKPVSPVELYTLIRYVRMQLLIVSKIERDQLLKGNFNFKYEALAPEELKCERIEKQESAEA